MEKDLVIGLGEIGLPIFKLFSKNTIIEGIDKNPKLSKIKPSLENHKISINEDLISKIKEKKIHFKIS